MTGCSDPSPSAEQGLVPSVRVESVLAQREALREALEQWREAGLRIHEQVLAMDVTPYEGADPVGFDCLFPSRDGVTIRALRSDSFAAVALGRLDKGVWNYLVKKSGIWSLMDSVRRRKWVDAVEHGDTPEMTLDNVQATFAELIESRHKMVDDGLLLVWRALSWDHKTNNPVMLNKKGKMIVPGVWSGFYGIRHDLLDDLERVLRVLDGVPQEDHRSGWRERFREVSFWEFKGATRTSDYLSVRVYKNGNGHITILNPAMVSRVNGKLAELHPDALPAPRR